MSGAELARRAGVSQPSVSRLEAGRRLADSGVAERLAAALLGVSDEEARKVVVLARDAYSVPPARRARVRVSVAPGQFRRRLLASRRVRSFSCAMVPMLLQTAEYAQAAATGMPGPASKWAGLVEDESRSCAFVVTEGALRTWPDRVTMADQLARVQAVSRRTNVRVGVLPWAMALPQMPLCDFMIADDAAVCVQTFTAGFTLARPEDVAAYAAAFEAFCAVAVFGQQADAVIADITADFGQLAASYSR
jgi:transcriptional regulator with XRE-family HTH domain